MPCQYTPLINLSTLIFGLMLFGWLHTRMLLSVYKTHGTEQNWEALHSMYCISHHMLAV
jgi:hypothetical protein